MKLRGTVVKDVDGWYIQHADGSRGGPFLTQEGARKVQEAADRQREAERRVDREYDARRSTGTMRYR